MASSVFDEGSPLDDYLKDSAGSTHFDALGLAAELAGPKGWTGPIAAEAGPSRSPSPIPGEIEHSKAVEGSADDNAAAERFRFLVCSSGLLEKEFAPHAPVTSTPPSTVRPDDEEGRPDNLMPTSISAHWVGRIRQRWDVVLAAAVLLAAIGWLLGREILLLVLVAVSSIFAVLRRRLFVSSKAVPTRPPASIPVPPSPPASDGVYPTGALIDVVSTSRDLDTAVGAALALLPPDATALSPHHDLRLALHRMTDRMADHLASASSQLMTVVNKEELAVMARLYDIDLARNVANTSPGHATASRQGDAADALAALEGRRWQSDVPSSPFKSFAMTPSTSMPGRIRPPHYQHYSISHVPLSPTMPPTQDKFTSLPMRTPRPDRSSFRHSMSMLDEHATVRRPVRSNRSSVYGGRSGATSPNGQIPSTHSPSRLVSPSPALRPSSPFAPSRSSPLTETPDRLNRRISVPLPLLLPSSSRTETEVNLEPHIHRYPLALSRMPTQEKRRSLQSLPYLRHGEVVRRAVSDEEEETARIHSMPVVSPRMQRRSLRDSLPTAWSLGSSLPTEGSFGNVSVSVPKPKLDRFPSISPLTLPALKASCLGIHLKRRKVACCLLALRFEELSNGYWHDVGMILGEMAENIRKEVAMLRAELDRAKKADLRAVRPSIAEPWPTLPDWSVPIDFAPRDSPAHMMTQHIEQMRQSLLDAWQQLERANVVMQEDNYAAAGEAWLELRGTLGDTVREAERGKECLRRLDPPRPSFPPPPTDPLDELPPFLQVWTSDVPLDPSSSMGSAESSHPEELDQEQSMELLEDERLPLPGRDELFEADAAPFTTKERRARRLLEDEGRLRAKTEAAASGAVLEELKGVIDFVRTRKGDPSIFNDTPGSED